MNIFDKILVFIKKEIAKTKFKRMLEIEQEYGPTLSTILRTMGHSEYERLDEEVTKLIEWCKNKEGIN